MVPVGTTLARYREVIPVEMVNTSFTDTGEGTHKKLWSGTIGHLEVIVRSSPLDCQGKNSNGLGNKSA